MLRLAGARNGSARSNSANGAAPSPQLRTSPCGTFRRMGQSGRSTRSEASGPGDPVIIDCSAEPVRIASSRVFHNSSEGSGQAHSNAGRAAVRFLINAHVGILRRAGKQLHAPTQATLEPASNRVFSVV